MTAVIDKIKPASAERKSEMASITRKVQKRSKKKDIQNPSKITSNASFTSFYSCIFGVTTFAMVSFIDEIAEVFS
jgi:hypothetical protein